MRTLTKTIPCCALMGILAGLLSPALQAQGGNAPPGTIYFTRAASTWSMNADGSGKTALPAAVSGEPSRLLHGGLRWFLQVRNLQGQTYPSGETRRELFAVRDDGNPSFELQLTTQPALELGGSQRWNPGDTKISWMARRWDLTQSQVLAGGVYEAEILFDGVGNVTGLTAQPVAPIVNVALVTWPGSGYFGGGPGPDLESFDWAPSGNELVYEAQNRRSLRIADRTNTTSTILTGTWCAVPSWSPVGSPIAFTNEQGGLSTIKPNGTGLSQLSKRTPSLSYSLPLWSPTGSHLTYQRFDGRSYPPFDVMRCTAAGKSQTSLTDDVAAGGNPLGWR